MPINDSRCRLRATVTHTVEYEAYDGCSIERIRGFAAEDRADLESGLYRIDGFGVEPIRTVKVEVVR